MIDKASQLKLMEAKNNIGYSTLANVVFYSIETKHDKFRR